MFSHEEAVALGVEPHPRAVDLIVLLGAVERAIGFHRADIDVKELEIVRTFPLSDSSELLLRLRGVAMLAGRLRASLAVSGGVHNVLDVVKATMVGADAVQMVSALVRSGPSHLRTLRTDLEAWLAENEWNSLEQMRGNMRFDRIPDPAAYERAHFRMTLQ